MSIVEFDGPGAILAGLSMRTGDSTKACIKGKRWRLVKLNDRPLRYHGRTGDYEQSTVSLSVKLIPVQYPVYEYSLLRCASVSFLSVKWHTGEGRGVYITRNFRDTLDFEVRIFRDT